MKEGRGHFLDGPRLDAFSKVTGRERYAADEYSEEFFWAGAKRALIPHARLLAVHTTRAAAHPGVLRVLTFRDVGGSNRLGIVRNHQPVLVDSVIRRGRRRPGGRRKPRGAPRSLDLITFDHEPLPGVFDPEDALEEAPRDSRGQRGRQPREGRSREAERGRPRRGLSAAMLWSRACSRRHTPGACGDGGRVGLCG